MTDLVSLTLATPLRPFSPSLGSRSPFPPFFTLTSLSLLPPFTSSFSISYKPTFKYLLLPQSDRSPICSLSKLVNLNLCDTSRKHPITIPPTLARIVSSTLTTLLLPRFTHQHIYGSSYQVPESTETTTVTQAEFELSPRFSCDPPLNFHPTRKFLEELINSGNESLKWVFVDRGLGHLGVLHHLPKNVEYLVLGPSRIPFPRPGEGEGARRVEELEELKCSLTNTNARLREIGIFFKKERKLGKEERDFLRGLVEEVVREVEEVREGCRVQVRWI